MLLSTFFIRRIIFKYSKTLQEQMWINFVGLGRCAMRSVIPKMIKSVA